jgi:(p)ppGpp synthase/HD superfamily hydrolase
MILTERFSEALVFAEALHRRQTRKGNDVPYVAHLLAVAALVLEWGGDEDVAIAALLHDAVEDQGGMATADLIHERFGDRVADIVLACTDSTSADPAKKGDWHARKRCYVEKLRSASRDVALVTAADKLHNLTAILRDIRREGPVTLSRFRQPRSLPWYFLAVIEALQSHGEAIPLAELRSGAHELERAAEGYSERREGHV